MTRAFADERIQFFLRHRDDIRAWAAIETEVTAAVRELLASCQATIEERIASRESNVTTTRRDGGRWERILVTRPTWPDGVGIALEWESAVDPFGSALPKIGVIFLSPDPSLETARLQVVAQAERASRLLAHGYRANAERTWPLLRRMDTHRNWWEEPESWASDGVERVIEVWNEMAPGLDQVFPEPPLIAAV